MTSHVPGLAIVPCRLPRVPPTTFRWITRAHAPHRSVRPGAGGTEAAVGRRGGRSGSSRGTAQRVRSFYFDYDSYIIKPEFSRCSDPARFLKSNARAKSIHRSPTAERGGAEYNLALASGARAFSARLG